MGICSPLLTYRHACFVAICIVSLGVVFHIWLEAFVNDACYARKNTLSLICFYLKVLEEETVLTQQRSWKLFQSGNGARSVVRVCVAVVVVSLAIVVALSVNFYATQATSKVHAETIDYNVYPYGECTWYANERFHEIYGYYVPWRYGDANEWVDRAYDYGWKVSATPSLHSIMVLQDGVQGATGYGHVGIVEEVEKDGSFIVSSMNDGTVANEQFWPGSGVAFIRP